jgi:hypothetical protein
MFEVFDPRNGVPLFTTKYRVVAGVVAYVFGYDFALTGEGWL